MKTAKKIVVTGGAGQIAYALVFRIAHGDLFGPDQPVILHLQDLPGMEGRLEGVAMELFDCAFPLLHGVKCGTSLEEQFEDVDLALLVGAKPRIKGMERADLLRDNGKIFVGVGQALNEAAKPSARVLVVGNPCNTNCLVTMKHAPKIPKDHFHAMMMLDHARACHQLAQKAKRHVDEVSHMVVWGNHSPTQVPDFTQAKIGGERAASVIDDDMWLREEFMQTVGQRGAAVIQALGKSSAASAANGVVEAVRAIYTPTQEGEWFTSAILSDENPYGIADGLVFGFPCRSRGEGDVEIVPGLPWDYFIREKIGLTQKELLSELEYCKSEKLL